jgi:hypothetical protein
LMVLQGIAPCRTKQQNPLFSRGFPLLVRVGASRCGCLLRRFSRRFSQRFLRANSKNCLASPQRLRIVAGASDWRFRPARHACVSPSVMLLSCLSAPRSSVRLRTVCRRSFDQVVSPCASVSLGWSFFCCASVAILRCLGSRRKKNLPVRPINGGLGPPRGAECEVMLAIGVFHRCDLR